MELNDKILLETCRIKLGGGSLSDLSNFGERKLFLNTEATKKVIDIATLLGKLTGLACVDCSASSDTVNVLKQVVDLGCCIVLANKKPLTSTIEDFNKLITHPRRIRHESTVGAGLPVIASLTRILSSGDPVHHIIGSLSGTLGYIMSEVEKGKPLSQVVKVAKSLGYTEPDPRDDLSGMDVARKALILARLLGQQINLSDIKVESLFPKEMGPDVMPINDFLDGGVLALDSDIQERVTNASSRGNVLRYACVIESSSSRCEVGLQEFPKDSPLGRLKGSDNVLNENDIDMGNENSFTRSVQLQLVVYSRCYNEQPLVIQGAGAAWMNPEVKSSMSDATLILGSKHFRCYFSLLLGQGRDYQLKFRFLQCELVSPTNGLWFSFIPRMLEELRIANFGTIFANIQSSIDILTIIL
uniref:Homoserine dehydrogenase n=1 Tax=Cucumis melo TaxID=3656 RepID=A0A9I9E6D8_CUCME